MNHIIIISFVRNCNSIFESPCSIDDMLDCSNRETPDVKNDSNETALPETFVTLKFFNFH